MNTIAEYVRNMLGVFLYSAGILLACLSGFGLSGAYLISYFTFALLVFLFLALFQDTEHNKLNYKEILIFNLKTFTILGILIFWISIVDYYFVELFKIYTINITDTIYWNIFFGSLIPVVLSLYSIIYYLSTTHISGSIRVIVLGTFILNSNLNDLLYYLLFNDPLPESWEWVTQPQFIFGTTPTTTDVLAWSSIAIVIGFIAASLPYEILILDKAERTKKLTISSYQKHFQNWVIIACILINGACGYLTIKHVKNNLITLKENQRKSLLETSNIIKNNTQKILDDNSSININSQRTGLAYRIIQELQLNFFENDSYPVSSGNCDNDWDSSYYSLPFSDNYKDPLENKNNNENCFLGETNPRIMYYSDGSRFVLLLSGANIDKNSNLYLPGQNDIQWFSNDILFYRDWNWNTPMLVYMFEGGEEVTLIRN